MLSRKLHIFPVMNAQEHFFRIWFIVHSTLIIVFVYLIVGFMKPVHKLAKLIKKVFIILKV